MNAGEWDAWCVSFHWGTALTTTIDPETDANSPEEILSESQGTHKGTLKNATERATGGGLPSLRWGGGICVPRWGRDASIKPQQVPPHSTLRKKKQFIHYRESVSMESESMESVSLMSVVVNS